MVLLTFVSGILFCTSLTDNINFATETFCTQMVGILMKSFTINATHIVALLQNTGSAFIEITSVYVTGLVTALVNLVKIAPEAIGSVIRAGNFMPKNAYDVKLGSIFNTAVTFEASL